VSTKPGRNDPCYCRSGKKYKRCHLPLDEQARPAPAPPPPEEELDEPPQDDSDGVPDLIGGPGKFKDPWRFLKSLTRSGMVKRVPGLKQVFKENETLFNFLEHEEEIEAAAAKLPASAEDFGRLVDDHEAFTSRTERLFSEDSFARLRFIAADVDKAFQKVGYPPNSASTEAVFKVYRSALLFLASKDLREKLAMELLLRVPGYVKQGRMMDAHLITYAADVTADILDEANPFLLRMFLYGLEAWADKQGKEEEAFLRDLEWDPKMTSPEEIDAWLADPAKTARLQELMAAHPGLRGRSQATMKDTDRRMISLLDREDAACLLLKPEEIDPWADLLEQRLRPMVEKYGPKDGGKLSEAQEKEAFSSIYLPAVREMTKGIFIPDRLRKLVVELRAYRNRLFAAGDKTAVLYATGAISYLEREDEPALNVFLLNLVGRSVYGIGSSAKELPGE
jgi:hypothetical protein